MNLKKVRIQSPKSKSKFKFEACEQPYPVSPKGVIIRKKADYKVQVQTFYRRKFVGFARKIAMEADGAESFLEKHTGGYSFRGNIRELHNMADDVASLKHLPETIRPSSAALECAASSSVLSLDEVRKAANDAAERHFLEEQLRAVRGNVTALAKRLNMNRSYLQTLVKKRMRAKAFKRK